MIAFDLILLGSAKLVTVAMNMLAYYKRDSIEAVAIVDLSNVLDFPRRSIHRMMWLLVNAKIFSAVIHAVSLVSKPSNPISMFMLKHFLLFFSLALDNSSSYQTNIPAFCV